MEGEGRRSSAGEEFRILFEAKALDLVAPILGRARSAKLCAAVWGMEKIRDVRTLRPLLRV